MNILSCMISIPVAITFLIAHFFISFDCVVFKRRHCFRYLVMFAGIQIITFTFFHLLFRVDNLLTVVGYCYTQLSLSFILLRYSVSGFLLLLTNWKGCWSLDRHHLLGNYSTVLNLWKILERILCIHYAMIAFQYTFY